jgi:hypothetical protein
MKHLKSSLSDLRRLFERTVTIRDIAEPLVSFDSDHDASTVRGFMEAHSFDALGVRENGRVCGYVFREALGDGLVGNYTKSFLAAEVLAESDPLTSALKVLRDQNQVFVTVLGSVGGVVARADLQKAPVRMWLFGLISLTEMHMQRLIREAYPDQSWTKVLDDDRITAAESLFKRKIARNLETDLSDCLEWADKATIFWKTPKLLAAAKLPSKTKAKELFRRLESLRNDLSHASDIIQGRWPELADRAEDAESLLQNLESTSLSGRAASL